MMMVVVFWGVSGESGQVHGVRCLQQRRVSDAFDGDGRTSGAWGEALQVPNAAESGSDAAVFEVIV
jgi:hypothetical protein